MLADGRQLCNPVVDVYAWRVPSRVMGGILQVFRSFPRHKIVLTRVIHLDAFVQHSPPLRRLRRRRLIGVICVVEEASHAE